MAKPAEPNRGRKRHGRRVLTAGAAASLVLTVSPALTPTNASASLTDDRPRTIHPSQTTVRSTTSRSKYRQAIRRAQVLLKTAQQAAYQAFAGQVAPIRQQYAAQLAAATTKAERVATRTEYGAQALSAKLALTQALAEADQRYINRREAARLAFLHESGADRIATAGARYRTEVHEAAVAYQLAVARSRSAYRLSVAPFYLQLRADLAKTRDAGAVKAARTKLRSATADASGVLQLQVRQARDTYQAKITLAKMALQRETALAS